MSANRNGTFQEVLNALLSDAVPASLQKIPRDLSLRYVLSLKRPGSYIGMVFRARHAGVAMILMHMLRIAVTSHEY